MLSRQTRSPPRAPPQVRHKSATSPPQVRHEFRYEFRYEFRHEFRYEFRHEFLSAWQDGLSREHHPSHLCFFPRVVTTHLRTPILCTRLPSRSATTAHCTLHAATAIAFASWLDTPLLLKKTTSGPESARFCHHLSVCLRLSASVPPPPPLPFCSLMQTCSCFKRRWAATVPCWLALWVQCLAYLPAPSAQQPDPSAIRICFFDADETRRCIRSQSSTAPSVHYLLQKSQRRLNLAWLGCPECRPECRFHTSWGR